MNPWLEEGKDEAEAAAAATTEEEEEEWRRRLRRGTAAAGRTSTAGSGGSPPAAAQAPTPAAQAPTPPAAGEGAEGDAWDGGATAAAAVPAAPAPAEWLPATDPGGSGATYWYNPRTGESSWAPPPGLEQQAQPPSSSSVAGGAGTGDVDADADAEVEADGGVDDDGAPRPALPAVVAPPAIPTLPPAVARLQRALDVADSSSASSTLHHSSDDVGGQGTANPAPALGAVEEGQPPLQTHPPHQGDGDGGGGWVELLDRTWGRLYYYHTGTGRTQWERPPGFRGDTVAPAYEPPPRPFTVAASSGGGSTHAPPTTTTADAIASWMAEAQQGPEPLGAGQELSVYEEMGYRASLNKRTGQVMIRGPMFERAEDDRDRRQLSHFVDLEALDRNREQEARRRQQAGRQQQQQQLGPDDWRRIREEKKAKKRRREVEWLLHD